MHLQGFEQEEPFRLQQKEPQDAIRKPDNDDSAGIFSREREPFTAGSRSRELSFVELTLANVVPEANDTVLPNRYRSIEGWRCGDVIKLPRIGSVNNCFALKIWELDFPNSAFGISYNPKVLSLLNLIDVS